MTYDKKFISHSLELFSKIKQNASIQECLNTNAQAVATAASDPNEPLWFIYYMFFAIHNPKMEDYIQKKTSSTHNTSANAAHIIKNMIKRRHYTSSIVFQLYTHAYTNEGNVTVIYPKDKDNLSTKLIRSFQSNRLKTTAVLLRSCATSAMTHFIEHLMTTQPTLYTMTSANTVLERINNHISYKQKNIILLALTCYMKIDEDDINKKNIFISATPEEEKLVVTSISTTATATATTTTNTLSSDYSHPPSLAIASTTTYDQKYKYLYN